VNLLAKQPLVDICSAATIQSSAWHSPCSYYRHEKVEQNRSAMIRKIIGCSFPPLNAFRFEGGPMKNLRSILAILVVLLTAVAAHAQQTKVTATVPFNFVAGDRTYPAGDYSFSNNGPVLQIANVEQATSAITMSQACESVLPSADTKLVFHRTGGYYILRQIWVAGNSRGRELPRSHTEVQLAQNHQKSESVMLAANIAQ
jgi:hypothetical protein